jgi:hypothetical protein
MNVVVGLVQIDDQEVYKKSSSKSMFIEGKF